MGRKGSGRVGAVLPSHDLGKLRKYWLNLGQEYFKTSGFHKRLHALYRKKMGLSSNEAFVAIGQVGKEPNEALISNLEQEPEWIKIGKAHGQNTPKIRIRRR